MSIICIIISIVSVRIYLEENAVVIKTEHETTEIQKNAAPVSEIPADPVERIIDWNYLHSINTDVVAWIYIPDTNIDYPVLQGEGDYYLHRNIYKQYDVNGSIFTNENIEDWHVVLFGHNMKQDVMFGKLQESDVQKVYLYTPERTILYDKQQAFVCSPNSLAFKRNFETKDAYYEWITEEELEKKDQILTLAACADSNRMKRYVIHMSPEL